MNNKINFTGYVTKELQFKFTDGDYSLKEYIDNNKDRLDSSFVTLIYELLGINLDDNSSPGDTFTISIKKLV